MNSRYDKFELEYTITDKDSKQLLKNYITENYNDIELKFDFKPLLITKDNSLYNELSNHHVCRLFCNSVIISHLKFYIKTYEDRLELTPMQNYIMRNEQLPYFY